jgi:hypothetical protein
MPLQGKDGDLSGNESDGSKSEKYCHLCYKDGRFINPNSTRQEMERIVDNALKEKGMNPIFRWFAKKEIRSLERWKK